MEAIQQGEKGRKKSSRIRMLCAHTGCRRRTVIDSYGCFLHPKAVPAAWTARPAAPVIVCRPTGRAIDMRPAAEPIPIPPSVEDDDEAPEGHPMRGHRVTPVPVPRAVAWSHICRFCGWEAPADPFGCLMTLHLEEHCDE